MYRYIISFYIISNEIFVSDVDITNIPNSDGFLLEFGIFTILYNIKGTFII